tara:strand:+ start:186 stop:443 length:258 start_codon:yes stop_codon:yes gene_type:complete
MAYYKPKVGILPAERCPADSKWLNENLAYLNDKDRKSVCNAYSKAFIEAAQRQPIEHRKEGAGRFAANTRLRLFIKKRFAVFNKE